MTRAQSGGSLVALMIGLAVSLAIVLYALDVLMLSGKDYLRTDQEALLQDQGTLALELVRGAVQQAGHIDVSEPMPAWPASVGDSAVRGLDDVNLPAESPGLDGARRGGNDGSDALAVHFSGEAQGFLHNCAGMPVMGPATESVDRGWSIFHVAINAQGEPELRCKYRTESGWVSQAVAAGVSSFQVLYGLDQDDDGLPENFVSASRLTALDAAGRPAVPSWTRVVAVQVAMLMRAPLVVRRLTAPLSFTPFGEQYAHSHGSEDPGTAIGDLRLRADRLYRSFDAVIFLPNRWRVLR